jgi:hypothetical protein
MEGNMRFLRGLLVLVLVAATATACAPGADVVTVRMPTGVPGALSDADAVLLDPVGALVGRDPPLSTDIHDATFDAPELDGYTPTTLVPLEAMPRAFDGSYYLPPGDYEITAWGFCAHAGTYAPSVGGPGYVYAPLKGSLADVMRRLLEASYRHPEVSQRSIQGLLWGILARTPLPDMPPEMQDTARRLLDSDDLARLRANTSDDVGRSLFERALQQLPPELREVARAEDRIRTLLRGDSVAYAALERAAVLTGNPPPGLTVRAIPQGRWSHHPDGYDIRYAPSGYSVLRIQIHVPGAVGALPDPGVISAQGASNAQGGDAMVNADLSDGAALSGNTSRQRLLSNGSSADDNVLERAKDAVGWMKLFANLLPFFGGQSLEQGAVQGFSELTAGASMLSPAAMAGYLLDFIFSAGADIINATAGYEGGGAGSDNRGPPSSGGSSSAGSSGSPTWNQHPGSPGGSGAAGGSAGGTSSGTSGYQDGSSAGAAGTSGDTSGGTSAGTSAGGDASGTSAGGDTSGGTTGDTTGDTSAGTTGDTSGSETGTSGSETGTDASSGGTTTAPVGDASGTGSDTGTSGTGPSGSGGALTFPEGLPDDLRRAIEHLVTTAGELLRDLQLYQDSAVRLDNVSHGDAEAGYALAAQTLERKRSAGVSMLRTSAALDRLGAVLDEHHLGSIPLGADAVRAFQQRLRDEGVPEALRAELRRAGMTDADIDRLARRYLELDADEVAAGFRRSLTRTAAALRSLGTIWAGLPSILVGGTVH